MFDKIVRGRHIFLAPCILALILAALAVYGRALDYGFVFDDLQFVVGNPTIRSFATVLDFFHSGFPLTRLTTLMTFAFNYQISGIDPFGYHALNILIHIAACLSVWWLASLVLSLSASRAGPSLEQDHQKRFWLSFCVALLFCVHPVQTQAVTYVTQRFSSLATLFYVLAVAGFIRLRLSQSAKGRWRGAILLGVSGLLAITSKEESVTLPLMILTIELMFFDGLNQMIRKGRQWLLVLVIGISFYFLFSFLFKSNFSQVFMTRIPSDCHDGDIFTTGTYLLTEAKVFTTFLRLSVWPFPQSFDYDIPMVRSTLDPGFITGAVLALLLILGAVRFKKSMPALSFGIVWFLVAFSANLVPRTSVIWEHKFYLMSFGLMLAVVVFLDNIVRNMRGLFVIILGVAVFWGAAAYMRNQVWSSDLLLWKDAATHAPDKSRTNNNLGSAYAAEGDLVQAEKYFLKSLAISPDNPVYNMMAAAFYLRKGDYSRAIHFYDRVIFLTPGDISAYRYKAQAYDMNAEHGRADEVYAQIIKHFTGNLMGHIWRGEHYVRVKDYLRARQEFEFVLESFPGNAQVLLGMSDLFLVQGDRVSALVFMDRAVQANPRNEELLLRRARFYYAAGEMGLAKKDIERALKINPYNPFFNQRKIK